MRGKLKLFEDDIKTDSTSIRKGRNSNLHLLRDKALVHRYYYYTSQTQMRYGAILEHLSNEFFLSTCTIQDRLNDHFALLVEIKKEKPSVNTFKKLYPHLNWHVLKS